MRERVCPRMVSDGRMKARQAERQIAVMAAMVEVFRNGPRRRPHDPLARHRLDPDRGGALLSVRRQALIRVLEHRSHTMKSQANADERASGV